MNHDRDDERFEALLRKFRPDTPRPLPGRGRVMLLRWRSPVLAAAVAAVLGVALFSRLHGPTERPPLVKGPVPSANTIDDEVSLGRLNALANEDQAKLDRYLDRISPQLLPDVQKARGVLRVLSVQ